MSKRHFGAIEQDFTSGSKEPKDSIWIPDEYKRKIAMVNPHYYYREVKQELTYLLSHKCPLFQLRLILSSCTV